MALGAWRLVAACHELVATCGGGLVVVAPLWQTSDRRVGGADWLQGVPCGDDARGYGRRRLHPTPDLAAHDPRCARGGGRPSRHAMHLQSQVVHANKDF